jgi:hypothetical protein
MAHRVIRGIAVFDRRSWSLSGPSAAAARDLLLGVADASAIGPDHPPDQDPMQAQQARLSTLRVPRWPAIVSVLFLTVSSCPGRGAARSATQTSLRSLRKLDCARGAVRRRAGTVAQKTSPGTVHASRVHATRLAHI